MRALDQALYSAILGGGFGLAAQTRSAKSRWGLRAGAFAAAAAMHVAHNLLTSAVVGLNVLSILLTTLGVAAAIVAIVWSLQRQHRWLRDNLASEVDPELYETMVVRGRRFRAAWAALKEGGLAGLWRVRRTHALCAELAFAKSQAILRPDDGQMQGRIERLRSDLRRAVDDRPDEQPLRS